MCGIAGYWTENDRYKGPAASSILSEMAGSIAHRGPDGEGLWHDPKSGIALAQRRLAIIDLSEAGAQPMHSESQRYCLIYNGEIYNHQALRDALEATGKSLKWRGHSDTETLLAAIERWGLRETLKRCRGMFAIALWDKKERKLSFARDRIGQKPLYYGYRGGALLFASELRAIRAFPDFKTDINRQSASLFLQLSYVPQPMSICQGIGKLQPGTIAIFDTPHSEPRIEPYWSFEDIARQPRKSEAEISFEQASSVVEETLSEVVTSQMISDVPLGAFLSGGIDSSLITALMQHNSARKVSSFSIGFEDSQFDESVHARQVAKHLGTQHTEFTVTEKDALDVIPTLGDIYDEPFADSSQLPTILLCRMAKQNVTVALSGDGGDEVFGGYNRHIYGPALWSKAAKVPRPLRKGFAGLMSGMDRLIVGNGQGPMKALAKRLGLPVTTFEKLSKFSSMIGGADSFEAFYGQAISSWPSGSLLPMFEAGQNPVTSIFDPSFADAKLESASASHIMALDTLSYLPDDIMVKVDRASMSTSLETRAPFLDARTIAQAWRLPEAYLTDGKTGKRILKDVLYRHVPQDIIERPKQGFSIPLDQWLRGELKDWAFEGVKRFKAQFCSSEDSLIVDRIMSDHMDEKQNCGHAIWAMLMLDSWV